MQTRCSVAEIDAVIHGARWREACEWDRLAWQTARLMNAAGSKPASPGVPGAVSPDESWTAEKLLGRPLTPADPRGPKALTEDEQAQVAEAREKAERNAAFLEAHAERMREQGRG